MKHNVLTSLLVGLLLTVVGVGQSWAGVTVKIDPIYTSSTDYTPTRIINGDFESPITTPYNSVTRACNEAGVNGGWNTTDSWFEQTKLMRLYNTTFSVPTSTFIELNADVAAVLSQDISTYPGEIIEWSLDHAMRTNNPQDVESMHVEIGAPDGNTAGVSTLVNSHIQAASKAVYSHLGITNPAGKTLGASKLDALNNLALYKNDVTKRDIWCKASGSYIVPQGQTTTRLAFMSDSEYPERGDLMDNVTFSTLFCPLQIYKNEDGNPEIICYWTDGDHPMYIQTDNDNIIEVDMTDHLNQLTVITLEDSWQAGKPAIIQAWNPDYPELRASKELSQDGICVVKFIQAKGGRVTCDKIYYQKNTTATVTPVCEDRYSFTKWVDENDNLVSEDSVYTFSITENVTLKPVYTIEQHKVTVVESKHLTITGLAPGGLYNHGAQASIYAQEDKHCLNWIDNHGVPYYNCGDPLLFNVTQDTIVRALTDYEEVVFENDFIKISYQVEPTNTREWGEGSYNGIWTCDSTASDAYLRFRSYPVGRNAMEECISSMYFKFTPKKGAQYKINFNWLLSYAGRYQNNESSCFRFKQKDTGNWIVRQDVECEWSGGWRKAGTISKNYKTNFLATETILRVQYEYNFRNMGWSLEPTSDYATITFPKNIEIIAPPSYDVTLHETETATSTLVVYKDQTYENLPTLTRDGYTFDGWWTQAEGGEQVTSSTTIKQNANHDLYAHWTAKQITVSYNTQSGSAVDPTSKQVTVGSAYNTLPETSLDQRDFLGWFTGAESGQKVVAATIVEIGEDHTLYAHWGVLRDKVTLDAHGGTCSVAYIEAPQNYAYGELPTPTRDGYNFTGWYTQATGGTKVESTTINSTAADHTIHAQWTALSYTVTFDSNGGSAPSIASKPVTYDAAYGELATTSRQYYNFVGWFTQATGGTQVEAGTSVKTASNHTLYAHWLGEPYTVILDPTEGTCTTPSIVVNYGGNYGTLPVPTHAKYDYKGWFSAATGGTKVENNDPLLQNADHTLYAQWVLKEVGDGTGEPLSEAQTVISTKLNTWKTESETKVIDVFINRTIYKDGYFNTLCVPFDLTADQIIATFKETPKELKQFLSASIQGAGDEREIIIETKDVTSIEAGQSYLISFVAGGETLTQLKFADVQVAKTSPVSQTGELVYQGIFEPVVLEYENQNLLFLGEENRLYWPKNDGTFLRGFRAYFNVANSVKKVPVKRGMKASFGRTVPTSNDNVNANDNNEIKKLIEEGRVVIMSNGVKYDMNGRKIVD